jgi:hypothetical protein
VDGYVGGCLMYIIHTHTTHTQREAQEGGGEGGEGVEVVWMNTWEDV